MSGLPGLWPSSTSLYGLPLTVLALAISLAIAEVPGAGDRRRITDDRSCGRLCGGPSPVVGRRSSQRDCPRRAGAILSAGGIVAPGNRPLRHRTLRRVVPAHSCRGYVGYIPDPAAPRGSPDLAEFDKLCTYRTPSPGQIVYTIDPGCKWAQIDPNYPLVEASGVLRSAVLSSGDAPWIHTSHDLGLDMEVDQESAWLVFGNQGPGALLHVEAESGPFPVSYRPVEGDRLRWRAGGSSTAGTNPRPRFTRQRWWQANTKHGAGTSRAPRTLQSLCMC